MAERLAEQLSIPADQRTTFVRFARADSELDAAFWGRSFRPQTNLPAQPTQLIGREADASAIYKRLLEPESRLLSLTGAPGIGKTRLALQVAAQAQDDFAEGVFFVALAPISDVGLVLPTIAHALGAPDVGPETPLQSLKTFLRDKRALLLLDNFEQLLAAAPQIAELLAGCPWVKVLVTSRAPLRIRQERQIPVSSLDLPDLAHLPDVESMTRYSAVTLFLERAQAVKPDFALTQDNAPTIAELCTRLDGLPLAIELISPRVKLLSPAALLQRLHGRLILQSDGLRDVEPRHRTLNAAIDWSHQLLNDEEQTLFRRLGVFVGGWTLEAAERICTEDLSVTIVDGLASLLDSNLVQQATPSDGEPRFMMLETIRNYALEQLVSSEELASLHRRHADYFLALAETPDPMLGVQQKVWWDRLEVEHANFGEALAWSQTEATDGTELRLPLALCGFWQERGHLSEGRTRLASCLTHPRLGTAPAHADPALRPKALDWLGTLCVFQGDLDAAQAAYEESLALFRELGDVAGTAEVLSDYGKLFEMRRDYEQANALLHESLVLSREIGNVSGESWCLFFLGTLAYRQDNRRQASMFFEESLMMMRAANSLRGIGTVLAHSAMVMMDEGDYDRASVYVLESLIRMRELGENMQTIPTLEVFAHLAAMKGQDSQDSQTILLQSARIFGAAEALRETISSPIMPDQQHSHEQGVAALRAQLNDLTLAAAWAEGRTMPLDQVVADALESSALIDISDASSHPADALRLAGAADGLRSDMGRPVPPAEQPIIERSLAPARRQLSSRQQAAAWAEGHALGSDKANALGPRLIEDGSAGPIPLTRREQEVAGLVARGLTNRQIAEQLVFTEATAAKHIEHILDKLSLTSRTQIAVWAGERRLLEARTS